MSRPYQKFWSLLALLAVLLSGCHPIQPFYFREDGDLSHYLDVATDIEYPDVDHLVCEEDTPHSLPPLTLKDADHLDSIEKWDLPLEDAVRIALENGKVLRHLGGIVQSGRPEELSRQIINTSNAATVYDAAIRETGYGGATGSPLSGIGVEAALAEFDARLDSSVTWNRNDRPQNANTGLGDFMPRQFEQESGNFTAGISKQTATGGTFFARNNTFYDANNNPTRQLPSDWTTNFEIGFQHPLLQGRGTQYNRIAGTHSFNAYTVGNPNSIDGVMIARINTDLTLADFEAGVRDFVEDIEEEYWDLHCAYERVRTARVGRDSALQSWQTVKAKTVGGLGASADESQARSQYYFFQSALQTALTELLRSEQRLRYSMGLPPADGQLIRPADDPTMARVNFQWDEIQCEALARRVELRKQKWELKKRELELIAARNHLLPRLDATGTYRWVGLGDRLIGDRTGLPELAQGSNAFESLTGGDYQEWELGLVLNVPIGFRAELTEVRHHQLLLAQGKAQLKNIELEVLHQLADAIREVDDKYAAMRTNFNRLVASEQEVETVSELVAAGTPGGTIDLLLDAQRRRADASDTYYRSLCDYNRAIMRVHREKGTLLEYNGVYLAEGPWPGKAYFDALRRARKRDAGLYLDYGFTRPNVVSQGPIQTSDNMVVPGQVVPGHAMPQVEGNYDSIEMEEVPTPGVPTEQSAPPTGSGESGELPPPRLSTNQAVDPSHQRTGVQPVAAQTSTSRATAESDQDETVSHHTTADTAETSPSESRTQRRFAGAGVRR